MANRPKTPSPPTAPRLYLVTPWIEDSSTVSGLETLLDAADIAALLVRLRDADERSLINRAQALAPLAQAKDVAVLLDGAPEIVARAGADGAHVRVDAMDAVLRDLKPDRIVGVGGLVTRHDAMSAAEAGADYVMFGDPDEPRSFESVLDRVAWWAEVFEIPCVGYATSLAEVERLVAAHADFIAIGDAAWQAPEGAEAFLREVGKRLVVPEPAR